MGVPATGAVGQVLDHGGSLEAVRIRFPDAPQPFIDLSTGINPHAYPNRGLPPEALTRLPEAARLAELTAAAVAAYGAPDPGVVAAAPGTQILLPAVMRLVAPGRARVLGPTYAEHERCARLAGHSTATVSDLDALAEADVAVVVNPNNPDGRTVGREPLLALAESLASRGGLLVVDEAFMDVGPPGCSLAPLAGRSGLLVLRSFGKFFGLAGVRLGFVLGEPAVIARVRDAFGPWAVSGPALELGIRALADTAWQEAMRRRLAEDAQRLDDMLDANGVAVVGGTELFRLARDPRAQALYRHLGQAGIHVRRFDRDASLLRFGLPGTEAEWDRVGRALGVWQAEEAPGRARRGGLGA